MSHAREHLIEPRLKEIRSHSDSVHHSEHTARVLLIEGHQPLLETITASLEPRGHEVVAVWDGVRGFLEFLRNPPDIVIFDLQVTGMTGKELIQEIRSRQPGCPIVLLSDRGAPLVSTLDSIAVLRKPFLPSELAKIVEDFLGAEDVADHSLRVQGSTTQSYARIRERL